MIHIYKIHICKLHVLKKVNENQRHKLLLFSIKSKWKRGVLKLRIFFKSSESSELRPEITVIGWWSKIYCEHRSKTFLSLEIVGLKTENMKKSTQMPLIFAYYGLLLKIRKVAWIWDDVKSAARFLSFYRLFLSHLELSQSRCKVKSAPPVARGEPRG